MNNEMGRDVELIELELFLEAVWRLYAYDFRQYARPSLLRRVKHRLQTAGLDHISEMIPRIVHDPPFFDAFLSDMSKTVTGMFRDPNFYSELRKKVIPILGGQERLRVWHAGCATGEEVYSFAILLEEAGLLDRAQIFATDYNYRSLAAARAGEYPLSSLKKFEENYKEAGGGANLLHYLSVHDECLKVNASLKKNITFTYHNLICDPPMEDIDIMICRNVLIYFEDTLQEKVIRLMWESLKTMGYLCLGAKESLDGSSLRGRFGNVSYSHKIFRRI